MIERLNNNIHRINFTKLFEALLISDVHWDNPKCKLDLLRSHLDEAKRRGAKVFSNGDLFCLMQGKGDPRRSKDDIRPEHNTGRYLDSIVETAVEWFAPYADTLVFVGYGNHETSIIKHQETDVLRRFVDMFNYVHKPTIPIQIGGYGGALIFSGDNRTSIAMKYYHGSGGGGAVTKGVIQNQRMQSSVEGYDIIWQGHVHELYHHTDVVERLRSKKYFTISLDPVHHIRTSTYKEEYGSGADGFHVEKGRPPKPLGGYWMQLELERTNQSAWINIDFTQCSRKY